LLECKREKNKYKLVSEQLEERYNSLKRRLNTDGSNNYLYNVDLNPMINNNVVFAQILRELKDQNKLLMFELEEVKTKLIDSEGDVRFLRNQIILLKKRNSFRGSKSFDDNLSSSCNCKEEHIKPLIEELEQVKNKNYLLERDIESLLDEKEELITTRKEYKAKIGRINEKLNFVLKKDCLDQETESKMIDIDSLLSENNYLNQRIVQSEEEKKAIKINLAKYKKMLERYNSYSIFSFGSKFNRSSSELPLNSANLLSPAQLRKFIESNNLDKLELTQPSLDNLKSLTISLFESLSDQSAALSLQKKNNKLLGSRIEQLEKQIREMKEREKMILMSKSCVEDSLTEVIKIEENGQANRETETESEIKTDSVTRSIKSDNSEIQLPPNLEQIVENELEKLRRNK